MPKNNGPVRDEFLQDVANHSMTVLLDQGVYRHLKFKGPAPNSWNQWFEIISTPSLLTVHGDMGTWCFSRVEDMFTFFRGDRIKKAAGRTLDGRTWDEFPHVPQ